uniref:Uncharacterized protein n=1 Tax=Tetradesmus obliquus TaxID=3088 RepID=A0A383V446_TETOB|eukprot:jgi/Sobl393_1/7721/SZX59489.1
MLLCTDACLDCAPTPLRPPPLLATTFEQGYLTAKRERMDHLLDGSWCYWNHDGEPSQPSSAALSEGGMGLPQGLQDAKGSSSSPALASHTVAMDEDDDGGDDSSSSSSSSSSSQSAVLINGSSSSSSSSSGGAV